MSPSLAASVGGHGARCLLISFRHLNPGQSLPWQSQTLCFRDSLCISLWNAG